MNKDGHYKPMPHDWSAEEIQSLCDLWSAGKTSSYIAEQLAVWHHTKRTRNAVIGKVHRLQRRGINLTKRPSPIHPKERPLNVINVSPVYCAPVKRDTDCAEAGCNFRVKRGSYCETHGKLYYVKPDPKREPIAWKF